MASTVLARTSKVSCRRAFINVSPLTLQRNGFLTLSLKHVGKHPAHAPCPSAKIIRQESTAAAYAIPPELDPSLPAEPPDMHLADKTENLPTFLSLKNSVAYPTIKALTDKPYNLKEMTSVQAEVLRLLPELAEPYDPQAAPGVRASRDLLVKAKTGTGKTFAFLVPAIEARINAIEAWGKQAVKNAGLVSDSHLEARAKRQFAREHAGTLIISPTRELATQIANTAIRLTHHHKEFEVRLFYGGGSRRMQMRDWMKGRRDIVVATPGRLIDLLQSEPEIAHGLSKCKMLVLDEADTLLDMGFRDDIDTIMSYLPPTPERQTFLFSATVSTAIRQVARSVLDKNHTFIDVVPKDESPVHAHIPQYHTVLPKASDQIPHLLRLLAHDQLTNPGTSKTMVFLPTTKMTQLFATLLRELSKTVLPAGRNTKVYEIHAKRTQDSRSATSAAFRSDKSGAAILVSSDVSARGVDYPGVTRVIQIGIPAGTDQYIHRVGRTGRGDNKAGRGDLVLLPWEIGFLSWQLNEVPLKPVTINEMKSQIADLCAKYDENPSKFFPRNLTQYDERGRPLRDGPRPFTSPIAPRMEDLDQTLSGLLSGIDEEAVNETFSSLLGYYVAKSPELRLQKGNIVEGLKDWSTEACGLPVPPYVSHAFLERLGVSDGRTKHFGKGRGRDASRRSGPQWSGRGQSGPRDREQSTSRWSSDRHQDDPVRNPEEYRGSRYGQKTSDSYGDRDNRVSPMQNRNSRSSMEDSYGSRDRWTSGASDRQRPQERYSRDEGYTRGQRVERGTGYGMRD
ncbi:P-loop containing nucleoside triphosphate hydrolase protein [Hygrophoropsis aurantiaca]|uniref:P-loop containing nucleoside triphosphate hydrolase protein n=1 Tax=Hygrophoropsis aurantiaca TaxID=72124 RepID=A0ACB8A9K2_9AGAM|nr:P-loop containing nucleoside triphosphate hydrolase protein [Hygrophoropsis aurantiaca]